MSPRSTRRRTALAAAALIPILAAAACSSSSKKTTSGGGGGGGACPASSGKVALSFWSWVPGVDKAVALWNSQNPNITVTLKNTPAGNAGTYQNMFNALKAGTAPDMGQIEYDSLASFRVQDGLADLSKCSSVSGAKDKFVDWTYSQASFGDTGLYAIPQDSGPMALYYRKDVFTRAGITKPPATWDEYAADAAKVKAIGSEITFFPQGDANWFTGLLWQNGAQLFKTSGDSWQVALNDPKAKQVADYWQKLIAAKQVATNLQGFSPGLYKAWDSGKVASWISAAWGYSTIRDNAKASAGKWAVAPMPQWTAGGTDAGNWGGSTTAVFKSSKHPNEAAKFALWLNTNPDSLKLLNSLGGLYPAAKDGLNLPSLGSGVPFYSNEKIFDVFKSASSGVNTRFQWGPIMTDTYRFMSDGFSKALNGGGTLTSTLDDAQTKTVAAMKSQSIKVSG